MSDILIPWSDYFGGDTTYLPTYIVVIDYFLPSVWNRNVDDSSKRERDDVHVHICSTYKAKVDYLVRYQKFAGRQRLFQTKRSPFDM